MSLGLVIAASRKAKGWSQALLASQLNPPLDYHLVSAWERDLSAPSDDQKAQLATLIGLPVESPAKAPAATPRFLPDRPVRDFGAAISELKVALGVRSVRQLAIHLRVPVSTLERASREELPAHIKFVIASVLGWELTEEAVFGMLSPTQRAKVQEIADTFGKPVDDGQRRNKAAEIPALTRRALDGSNSEARRRSNAAKPRTKAVASPMLDGR